MTNFFETSNRQLENFLFVHDIKFVRFYKRESDMMTVWVYKDTPYLHEIIEEYKTVVAHRRNS